MASNSRHTIKNEPRLLSGAHPVAHTSYQVELYILPGWKEQAAGPSPLLNSEDGPARKRNVTGGT